MKNIIAIPDISRHKFTFGELASSVELSVIASLRENNHAKAQRRKARKNTNTHRNTLRGFAGCLLVALCFILGSCDSGDIYPDENRRETGVVVKASFAFKELETFPAGYQILFGAFGNEKAEPLISKTIVKPKAGDNTTITLTNLPDNAVSLKLCLTTLGKQPVFTFFETDIPQSAADSIVIPIRDIHLLQYDRVQQQVFSYSCVACHGGSGSGAGKLNLEPGKSRANLVNVTANKDNTMKRVVPSNVEQSFLIRVLEQGGLLNTEHTSAPSKYDDDITLLKEWIKAGAEKN